MLETDTCGKLTKEIQGNILRGYTFEHARFAFVELESADAGRQWLGQLPVTDGRAWSSRPDVALNVAVSHAGLAKLGVHAELLDRFSPAFRAGMQSRHAELGDASDTSGWDAPFKNDADRIHVLVSLYGDDAADLDTALQQCTAQPGIQALDAIQHAARLGGREHFGFQDGISQPIQNDGINGWISKEGVPIREFLLFDASWADAQGAASPKLLQLGRLGSYLVYRKLRQDVARFRSFVQGWPLAAEQVAAKLVGRWRNGTPLTKSPDAPSASPLDSDNEFDYLDTGDLGQKCPYGAHISRANPRKRLSAGSNDHRILRRGMPYGEPRPDWLAPYGAPLPENDTDPEERGLIFLCLNARLEQQFEFLQRAWLNEPSFLGQDGSDPIANSVGPTGPGHFRAGPGYPPWPLERFVELKGGQYFFVPSMDAIDRLAANEFGTP